jgi:hypothetical protein
MVPLFSITANQDWTTRLKAAVKLETNLSSHFDIFPTLLISFGYNEQAVRAKYGPSLLEPADRGRRFLVGFDKNNLRWIAGE